MKQKPLSTRRRRNGTGGGSDLIVQAVREFVRQRANGWLSLLLTGILLGLTRVCILAVLAVLAVFSVSCRLRLVCDGSVPGQKAPRQRAPGDQPDRLRDA